MIFISILFSVLFVSIESFKATFPIVQRHHKLLPILPSMSYMLSKEKISIQKSTKLFFKGLIAPEDTTKVPTKSPLKQLVILLKTFWKFTFLALFRVLLAPFGFIVGKIFTSKSKYLEEEEDVEILDETDDVTLPQVSEADKNFLKAKELAALRLKESKSIAVAKKAVQKRLLEIEKKSPISKTQSSVVVSPPRTESVPVQSYPKIVTESPIVLSSSVDTVSEIVVNSEPTVIVDSLTTTETKLSPLVTAESLVAPTIVEEPSPVFESASMSPIVEEIALITNKNIAAITSNELEIQPVTQSTQDNVAMEAPAIASMPAAVAESVLEYVVSEPVTKTVAVAVAESTSMTAESVKVAPQAMTTPIIQTSPEPAPVSAAVTQIKVESVVQPQTQTEPQLIITGPFDPNAVMNDSSSGDDYLSSLLPQSVKELNDRIKSAGVSGTVAYVGVEVMFWAASVPLAVTSYHSTTGAWLSLTDPYDQGKILALTTTFAAAARIAVPFRLAAAVALMPWVEKNIANNNFFSNSTSSSTATATSVSEVNDLPMNES